MFKEIETQMKILNAELKVLIIEMKSLKEELHIANNK